MPDAGFEVHHECCQDLSPCRADAPAKIGGAIKLEAVSATIGAPNGGGFETSLR
jgi:hypothetical protein